jgi:GNAT superfamily N-acetyltransferase
VSAHPEEESVIAAPQIERATLADLDALARLRAAMDWNRSDPLLKATLTWEHGRIFVIRAGALTLVRGSTAQAPAATTSAIAAGSVGVIGNVAVRPEFQRRGLAKLLTTHAIAWQRAQGVRAISLDATPAGRPLYRTLGFVDVAASWYVQAPLRDLHYERLTALAGAIVADAAPADALPSVAAVDQEAFGGDRLGLLHALAEQDVFTLYVAHASRDAAQRPLGYALARRTELPIVGVRIGPLVASNDAVAAALTLAVCQAERERQPAAFASGASQLIASCGDMPAARAFFTQIGAAPTDDDLVMRLSLESAEPPSANNDRQRAAGNEERPSVYSWVSPMLF